MHDELRPPSMRPRRLSSPRPGWLGSGSLKLSFHTSTSAVPDAAKGERLWPYVAVSMLGGIRTEEARALRWSGVDLEAGTVAVYRSVRRQLRPVTRTAAIALGPLFEGKGKSDGGQS